MNRTSFASGVSYVTVLAVDSSHFHVGDRLIGIVIRGIALVGRRSLVDGQQVSGRERFGARRTVKLPKAPGSVRPASVVASGSDRLGA